MQKKLILIIGYNEIIIGFIGLLYTKYIKIAIIKKYQNKGIATAMIDQLLQIYGARNFTNKIYIDPKDNLYLNKIAIKLLFVKNSNNQYEIKCKIPIYI